MRFATDLARFKADTDVIVVNRMTAEISDVAVEVYSRNLSGQD